jgi:predicted secreted protein
MKPNAARAATGLPAASLAFLIKFSTPAFAGDRALLDVIGFSEDGRFFAFEEYGVQDGSGFPYSNIYVVDVIKDDWFGPPTRVLIEDETAGRFAARTEAMAKAAPLIAETGIDYPADMIAVQGDGEGGDGLTLDFSTPGYFPGETSDPLALALEMFPVDSPQPCEDYLGEKAKGFELTLTEGDTVTSLHQDADTIPGSRGCPTTYRIYAVVVPQYFPPEHGVAIISVYPFGFEGPDRRFIAVPLAH